MTRARSTKGCIAPVAKQNKKKVATFAAIAAAAVIVSDVASSQSRRPLMDGSFKGHHWLRELLAGMLLFRLSCLLIFNHVGRNERFRRMFGMNKKVFRSLVYELCILCGLSGSRYVSAEEKLAIFLRAAVSGGSNQELQERFMRGGATISMCVNSIYCIYKLTCPQIL